MNRVVLQTFALIMSVSLPSQYINGVANGKYLEDCSCQDTTRRCTCLRNERAHFIYVTLYSLMHQAPKSVKTMRGILERKY